MQGVLIIHCFTCKVGGRAPRAEEHAGLEKENEGRGRGAVLVHVQPPCDAGCTQGQPRHGSSQIQGFPNKTNNTRSLGYITPKYYRVLQGLSALYWV